jgi:hypothetical protein
LIANPERGPYSRFIMKNLVFISSVMFLVSATSSLFGAESRKDKVLNDRQELVEDGYWIYNDLDKGLELAQQTGKPLMVVFRCLP